MNWFIVALVPPFLWAVTNHIDKFLIEKFFRRRGMGALIIFSALIGIILLPIILIIEPNVFNISPINALILIASGVIYILATLFYLYALVKDEASVVVPVFQIIPIFGYLLGYFFLYENISFIQGIASLLVILGAVLISLDLSNNKIGFKKKMLVFMLISSFFYALNLFIFKFVAIQSNFWITSFWEYMGLALVAIFTLFFIKSYRQDFFEVIKVNSFSVLGANALNEFINIIAKMAFNFATLLAPLVLISVTDSIQPLFVLIIGILLTLYFPRLGKESITRKHLLQRIIAIITIIIGAVLLNLYK